MVRWGREERFLFWFCPPDSIPVTTGRVYQRRAPPAAWCLSSGGDPRRPLLCRLSALGRPGDPDWGQCWPRESKRSASCSIWSSMGRGTYSQLLLVPPPPTRRPLCRPAKRDGEPAVGWNTVKMCEHAGTHCLRGRLTLQSLSLDKLNSRAQIPEDSPECPSEGLLAPTRTHQTAMDCRSTTGQPEQT